MTDPAKTAAKDHEAQRQALKDQLLKQQDQQRRAIAFRAKVDELCAEHGFEMFGIPSYQQNERGEWTTVITVAARSTKAKKQE